MRRFIPALSAWVLLTAAAATQGVRHPVVGGVAAPSDSAVVLVLIRDDLGNDGVCSGAVVGPHRVLTAAHCIAPQTVGREAEFRIFLGGDYEDPARAADPELYAEVTAVAVDPRFDAAFLPGGYDVGVLHTREMLPAAAFAINGQPQSTGMLSEPTELPAQARFWGYGVEEGSGGAAGLRRTALVPVRRVDERLLEVGDAEVTGCGGDSGGPVVAPATGAPQRIIGVLSYSTDTCAGPTRVADVAASMDFISEQLAGDRGSDDADGHPGGCG